MAGGREVTEAMDEGASQKLLNLEADQRPASVLQADHLWRVRAQCAHVHKEIGALLTC